MADATTTPTAGSDNLGGVSSSQPSAQHPHVFVKRGHDVFVPMVALDELPDYVAVIDVPLTYTERQIQDIHGHVVWGEKAAEAWNLEIDRTKIKLEEGDSDTDGLHVPSTRAVQVSHFHLTYFIIV